MSRFTKEDTQAPGEVLGRLLPADDAEILGLQSTRPRRSTSDRDYTDLLEQTVPDVTAYLDAHPDETSAVRAQESLRDHPRKTILEHEPSAH